MYSLPSEVQTLHLFSVILFHYSFFVFSPAIISKPNLLSLYGMSNSSVVIHHCPRLIEKRRLHLRGFGEKMRREKNIYLVPCIIQRNERASSFQRHKLLLTTPNYLRDLKLVPSEAHFRSPTFLMDSFQKGW